MPVAVSPDLRLHHDVTDFSVGKAVEGRASQKTCLHLTFVAFGNKSKRD